MLRFPDARVEYRIEDDQFEIPALTIQPLVENAIRHGIRYRKDGLVTITARRDSGWHQITIQDNGVGFDTKEQKSAGGTHVGLINVKDRIEQMCRGTMAVKSEIGKGTSVTLRIPDSNVREKKGRKNEGDLRG